MKGIRLAAIAALAAAACGPAAGTDLVASPLAGSTWRIAAIDGKPAEGRRGDGAEQTAPQFAFGWRSYGGNAGCNAMGGLYAQVGDRFYTLPGPQTAMACGSPHGEQEEAANAIFAASPTVVRGRDSILLSGGDHTMELVRAGRAPDNADPPMAWQGFALAGQSFAIEEVNGVRTDGMRLWKNPPRLRFGNGEVTMALDCPQPAKGAFVQSSEHLHAALLTPTCATAPRDKALSAILGADPRVVSGPNGELLLASAKGWAILWNERRDRPK
jgi:heat shock protein HslJ